MQLTHTRETTHYANGGPIKKVHEKFFAAPAEKKAGPISKMAGGKISGPGTGTSDSVPIAASKGEYVMPADSTAKIGVSTLDALKNSTHKPVAKTKGPIAHMANGGLVTDPMGNSTGQPAPDAAPPTMSYGDQMGAIAKTVFSAPGYGASTFLDPAASSAAAPAAAAPVAPNPQDQRLAAGTQTAPMDPVIPPDPTSNVTLGGQAGTAVAGAPGTFSFKTATGSPLYSNVTGTSNDALMARGPISAMNQGALNGIQARQDAGDASRAMQAQNDKEVADAAATNAAGGFGTGQANQTPRQMLISQLANRKLSAKGAQVASDLMRNDTAGGQLAVSQGQLGIAQAEAVPKIGLAENQLTISQRLAGIQQQYLAEKDPQKRRQLYEAMIASQGHIRALNERVTAVNGGSQVDDQGRVIQNPAQLYDNENRQWISRPAQQPASGAAAAATGKGITKNAYDALPKGSTYTGPDGKQYTKG